VQLIDDRVLVPKPVSVTELFGCRIHDQSPPDHAGMAGANASEIHCKHIGTEAVWRPSPTNGCPL
jgi:hypothetical protein